MYADRLFVNGQVVLVDARNQVAEALATLGERILAVGRTEELLDLRGPHTQIVDLGGRALLPGLIDAHAHISSLGLLRMGVDCGDPRVRSITDIQTGVRAAAKKTPPGQWVRGWRYNEDNLEEGRHPNRYDLDQAVPNHPVYLGRVCYHTAVLNSKALALAGITSETPDPKGGRIGRDEHGQPNGILYENASFLGRKASIPTLEELRKLLRAGSQGFLAHGVTSMHDAWGLGHNQIRALSELNRSGELKVRVYEQVGSAMEDRDFFEYFEDAGLVTGFGDNHLRIGPVKWIADGAIDAATAALRYPYDSNPSDTGVLIYSQEEMDERFLHSHRAGFQLAVHAQGDRAIEMVIRAIEKALVAVPRSDPRPRIEHCALLDPDLMRRIQQLGIIPVPQPGHFHDLGDAFLRDYGERTRYMFPCRSLLKMGVRVAGSSDCPVVTANPFEGIYGAMTRLTRSGQVVGPEERLTLDQSIRLYTINGAYASFEEKLKGSLEPGKLADLAILSGPILGASPDTVRELKAEMTVVGGEVVHDTGVLSS